MPDAPVNIRSFEGLQLVAISVNLIRNLPDVTFTGTVAGRAMVEAVIGGLLVSAIGIALTLLVSRRRKNWARWAILAFSILGVAFLVWQGKAPGAFTDPLTALIRLMHAVALALVFTPQAGRWLRADQSKSLQDVFE